MFLGGGCHGLEGGPGGPGETDYFRTPYRRSIITAVQDQSSNSDGQMTIRTNICQKVS